MSSVISEVKAARHRWKMSVAMQEFEEWQIVLEPVQWRLRQIRRGVSKKREEELLWEKATMFMEEKQKQERLMIRPLRIYLCTCWGRHALAQRLYHPILPTIITLSLPDLDLSRHASYRAHKMPHLWRCSSFWRCPQFPSNVLYVHDCIVSPAPRVHQPLEYCCLQNPADN